MGVRVHLGKLDAFGIIGYGLLVKTGILGSTQTTIDDNGLAVTTGGVERVRAGAIGGGDYGLKVTNAGSTVIIDGTSNMFKILATGTVSRTQSDPGGGTLITTLSGLGTFSATPAHLSMMGTGGASGDIRRGSLFFNTYGADMYVASTSGGSPTIKVIVAITQGEAATDLNASSEVDFRLFTRNRGQGSDVTIYCRYYILNETAI